MLIGKGDNPAMGHCNSYIDPKSFTGLANFDAADWRIDFGAYLRCLIALLFADDRYIDYGWIFRAKTANTFFRLFVQVSDCKNNDCYIPSSYHRRYWYRNRTIEHEGNGMNNDLECK